MRSQLQQLPTLADLLEGLERAFAHHVEVEAQGPRTRVLRLAGKEFRLAGVSEAPEALIRQLCQKLAEVAAFGLATALTEDSVAGTRLRMDLITALATVESTRGVNKERLHAEDGELLLTTAEAAARLGRSRPYISMLCDQGKLGEVSRSEGGHRRIRQSAVDEYRRTHLGQGRA